MSHFTVLVIGDNAEEQLAPFQENNMGNCPQELLKFRYDGEYYDNEQAAKEAIGEEFDKEEGYWENPNKKWDWYSLGGRWTGFFKLRQGVMEVVGTPGLMTGQPEPGHGDSALKSEIDFDLMRDEAGLDALNKYELAFKFLSPYDLNESWDSIRERMKDNISAAREFYWSQPRCKAWTDTQQSMGREFPFGWGSSPDQFLMSKEEYIENARNNTCVTHAVIKDGKWYECGEMGWWGVVHNEKDSSTWAKEFSNLIDSLPDDTILSVYDCHI